MNKKQGTFLWLGVIIFSLMGIYPPWVSVHSIIGVHRPGYEMSQTFKTASGYALIFYPPKVAFIRKDTILRGQGAVIQVAFRVDLERLIIQWIIVSLIFGGMILTTRKKEDDALLLGKPVKEIRKKHRTVTYSKARDDSTKDESG